MDKVKITKRCYPDQYWLNYVNSNGVSKQVSLTACANNFRLQTNDIYNTGDGMQPVGWRYESGGCLCYELFCVGHVQLYYPLQPGLLNRALYLLQGKDPEAICKLQADSFEQALNRGGWKTVVRSDGI